MGVSIAAEGVVRLRGRGEHPRKRRKIVAFGLGGDPGATCRLVRSNRESVQAVCSGQTSCSDDGKLLHEPRQAGERSETTREATTRAEAPEESALDLSVILSAYCVTFALKENVRRVEAARASSRRRFSRPAITFGLAHYSAYAFRGTTEHLRPLIQVVQMALCRSRAARFVAGSAPDARVSLTCRVRPSTAPYSTDSSSQPSVHEVQSVPRKRELRKVAEGAGQTAQLIRAAVQNTSNRASGAPAGDARQRNGPRTEGQRGGRPQSASQGPARVAPGMHRAELQRLLEQRKAAAARGQTEAGYAPSGGASHGGPHGAAGGGGPARRPPGPGGRPRPPRAGAAPGTPGAPRPRKPAQPRRPARAGASGPRSSSASDRWSPEDLKPLVPPSHVSLRRANLAGLVKASALAESSQLRAALVEVGVSVDAKEKAERDQARKVLEGDYSPWLGGGASASAGGKKDAAKKGAEAKGPSAVDQARAALSLNATIPLRSRQKVLDRIREATV